MIFERGSLDFFRTTFIEVNKPYFLLISSVNIINNIIHKLNKQNSTSSQQKSLAYYYGRGVGIDNVMKKRQITRRKRKLLESRRKKSLFIFSPTLRFSSFTKLDVY